MTEPETDGIQYEDSAPSFQFGAAISDGLSLRLLTDSQWDTLEAADRVAIRRQGENLQTGTVDGPIENPDVFWVWLDEGRGRVLLHRDDEPRIWCLV
ncbi:hypothetical protein [Paenarthrobacter ureafaciens]|uniref:hypothetical protein n=1 Tax=Paenarthrobacter ureafaciens TaxID=37931 RepID=UPI000397FD6F|nr:hypothetical protein [Paenarthrobacter ureafaciens]MCY0975691.1 hypothetical protein [Paenarthrobacter ureafaciens]